jgi:hypothetical protein
VILGGVEASITDTEVDTKLVDLHGLRARVEQIRAKYAAAYAEDDQKRSEKWQAMHALGNQIMRDRSRGGGAD